MAEMVGGIYKLMDMYDNPYQLIPLILIRRENIMHNGNQQQKTSLASVNHQIPIQQHHLSNLSEGGCAPIQITTLRHNPLARAIPAIRIDQTQLRSARFPSSPAPCALCFDPHLVIGIDMSPQCQQPGHDGLVAGPTGHIERLTLVIPGAVT